MDYPFLFVWLMLSTAGYTDGSLQLSTFPERPTEGNSYTLICSSRTNARALDWFWKHDRVITSRFISDARCIADNLNNVGYNTRVSGRVTVTCSLTKHNVSLRIHSVVDRGSVWWCRNAVTKDTSNTITIDLNHPSTASVTTTQLSPRTTSPSASTTTSTTAPDVLHVVYIAVGVAAAVVSVVSVLCVLTRKEWCPFKKGNTEHTGTCDRNASIHTHSNSESPVLQDHSDPDKVTVENDNHVDDTSFDSDSTEWSSDKDHEDTDINAPHGYSTSKNYENMGHQYDAFTIQEPYVNTGDWTESDSSSYVTLT
ncbi:uncharacterized protein LOC124287333 isoform X2 [Haliotis rubra]|uniref:uncharacterized protein LOC124287333 isoform X2 n=1 Tax=Haliotis rubra TaxID=36100 RepID=UPI001EE4EB84|nr:uncharacterized protein LOC124287333 isoform X2 [Haliotis rubra]